MAVADLTFEFLAGHEGGHGVDDDDIQRIRADQRFADAQGFFTAAGLGDEQFIHLHAKLARVAGIERVLHIDEGCQAAGLLRLGDDRERERRLAGGFRSIDFHDASAREAADAERLVDQQVAGGDDRHVHLRAFAHAQDRAFAVVLLNLLDGEVEVLGAGLSDLVLGGGFGGGSVFWGAGHGCGGSEFTFRVGNTR